MFTLLQCSLNQCHNTTWKDSSPLIYLTCRGICVEHVFGGVCSDVTGLNFCTTLSSVSWYQTSWQEKVCATVHPRPGGGAGLHHLLVSEVDNAITAVTIFNVHCPWYSLGTTAQEKKQEKNLNHCFFWSLLTSWCQNNIYCLHSASIRVLAKLQFIKYTFSVGCLVLFFVSCHLCCPVPCFMAVCLYLFMSTLQWLLSSWCGNKAVAFHRSGIKEKIKEEIS